MKKSIIILQILFGMAIFLASCDKATETMISSPATNPSPPPTPLPENLSWYTWYKNDSSGTGLWTISGFGDAFKNVVSRFDSTYYHDHVRVYLKFFGDSASWRNIPYSAHDHSGQHNFDVYFTDDNYTINLGQLGTFLLPGIIIYAKPTAHIYFSKKVAVKIVVN